MTSADQHVRMCQLLGKKKEKNFWFRQSESTLVDAALHFADWDHLVD